MSLKYTVFILLVFCSKYECANVRIMYARCNYGGFTCTTVGTQAALHYQCPAGTNDITFYLHSFNAPSNIASLVIKNCTKVILLLRCTDIYRNIKDLTVMNIEHLILERTNFVSTIPPTFILENINYLETIPSFTFSQYRKVIHSDRCAKPTANFGNFSMTNVRIDTVESNAFYMPYGFEKFHISNVTINRLQSSAMTVKLFNNGSFTLDNSTINVLEHLAVQVVGRNVTISNNKFVDISSSGINGTMENFIFEENYINTLQPQAFSILSKNVLIQNNRFEYLKSGALEKISPGLLEDSGRNFGSLRFHYMFKENYVSTLDAGSLHPDVVAYNNVASDVEVLLNQFNCRCENIAWMISPLGHGTNTDLKSDLHNIILDNETKNICANSCRLPLSSIKKMMNNGECSPDITIDYLCGKQGRTTVTTQRSIATSAVSKSSTTKKPTGTRRFLGFFNSGSTIQNHFIILLLMLFSIRQLM